MRFLRQPIHQSWLIALASAAIVVGVAVAPSLPAGAVSGAGWLCTGVILVSLCLLRPIVGLMGFVIVGGLLVGAARGSVAHIHLQANQGLYDRTLQLYGTIKEDVDTDKRGQAVLRLTDIRINHQKIAGSVWVTTKTNLPLRRSDQVVVNGKLDKGFGNFSASMYSATLRAVKRPMPGDVAVGVRDWFSGGVQKTVKEPQASLGLGYLVGQRRGLPQDLDDALRAAGLTHIVVASGYNLTILVRFARRVFEKISRYLALITASSMIAGFVAITGLSPSMSRAGLVAGLSLLAWYYGRRFHPLVLLPFAMAITLLIQPSFAWGDIGWQLSFAAFAGVMIVAPLIQKYFFGDTEDSGLRRIFIETMSAQVCTLPILLYSFGQISVVAPVANVLILPLVPLAMVATFIAGLAGLFVPGAAILGLPAQLILTYMTTTAQYIGGLSWSLQHVSINGYGVVLIFMLLGLLCVFMWYQTRLALERTSLVE